MNPYTNDLVGVMPPYFQEQRALMAGDQSPFEAMLHNPHYCVFPESKAVTDRVYVAKSLLYSVVYKQYCADNGIKYKRPASNTDTVSVFIVYNTVSFRYFYCFGFSLRCFHSTASGQCSRLEVRLAVGANTRVL